MTLPVVAAGVIALAIPAAAGLQPSNDRLGSAVKSFLTIWLVERNPEVAVKTHVSRTLNDERFVPAEWFGIDQYHAKFDDPAARRDNSKWTITADEFAKRMTEYLKTITPPAPGRGAAPSGATRQPILEELVPSFTVSDLDKVPDLKELIASHRPANLPAARAIVYPVERWADFSWTASGTVGFRGPLAERVRKTGVPLRGVVARLASAQKRPALLFMLWADESVGKDDWKLWGLEPVPVD
jgi:hypothetical protein